MADASLSVSCSCSMRKRGEASAVEERERRVQGHLGSWSMMKVLLIIVFAVESWSFTKRRKTESASSTGSMLRVLDQLRMCDIV